MSPLLFVLGMEYLSRILMKASTADGFKFHSRCKHLHLTHLAFADDLMILSKGNLDSIRIMKQGLNLFSCSSGLIANSSKSVLHFRL